MKLKKPDFSKVKDKIEALSEKLKNLDENGENDDLENIQFDPADLKSLQSDLEQFKLETAEPAPKQVEWKTIMPKVVEQKAVFTKVENYWLNSLISVIRMLLDKQDFKAVFKQLQFPHNFKNAILKRLYDKVKVSKPEDYNIFVLE